MIDALLLRILLNRIRYIKGQSNKLMQILRGEPIITPGSIQDKTLIELLGRQDPVILDIGCNEGQHTQWFLDLFNEARVYSFEPDPRARKRYLTNVKDKRAVLFDIAISDTDGVVNFHTSSGCPPTTEITQEFSYDWDFSGSIRRPKQHLEVYPWVKFDKKVVVKTKKLDTWVREEGIEIIDLIWADVQGAEIDLINGGREALRNTRYFYTEYSDMELYEGQINLRQLMDLLPDFKVVHIYKEDVLLKNRRIG